MAGKNRIMIYGPKDDGTYVVEFMTAEGHNEHHGGSWTGLEVSGEQPRDWRAWRKEFLATGRRPGWQPR